jgi:acetyl esterase/lipase
MTMLPSVYNYRENPILDRELLKEFIQKFLPGMSIEYMKDPSISPLYEDLNPFRGNLPSAFFTCGTNDALLDDSVLMHTKWTIYRGEAIIKFYSRAHHGFLTTLADELSEAWKALEDTKTYIRDCMAGAREGNWS